jgi:hypothetical protein
MDEEVCDKSTLEEIVCRFIKNNYKRISIDQIIKIYELLQSEIIDNSIPEINYWRIEKERTFDFSIDLEYVSVATLSDILNIAGFKK